MNDEISKQIISTVKNFVKQDVHPVVKNLEENDFYPEDLANKMAELGVFGIIILQKSSRNFY